MTNLGDWTVWLLVAAVVVLFVWYFVSTARHMWTALVMVVQYVNSIPARRRALAEAEAKSGIRTPLWLQAARALVLTLLVVMLATMVWNKLRP